MRLSKRVMRLKPSATLAVNALAQELQAAGRDIISLSLGEPDFNTPDNIGRAGIAAINTGFTKYTPEPGINELRAAVAAYFNSNYSAGVSQDYVHIGNGGKQCLYNLFLSVLDPGDEALIPAPYWVSYPAMVELADGVPVIVPTRVEDGFKVTVEALERHYTPKTRLLIINSPSNPTGAAYTQAEMDAMAEWAVEKNILLVSDEIYDQLVYAPATPVSLSRWCATRPENVAVVNGVAKSYAMTGWRLGYLLAHPDIIKASGKLQGQTTSNVCSISQKAALEALTGDQQTVIAMRRSFEKRRDLVVSLISEWPDVICPTPQGAFYAFPDLHRLYNSQIKNSGDMCKFLLEKAGVALVPGEAFGDDKCVRLSYATSEELITEALTRVRKALFNK